MAHILFLAWQYLRFHKLKTSILVTAVTLTIYLPVALNVVVAQSSAQLMSRAVDTPLLAGSQGSPVELVLNALYFGGAKELALSYADLTLLQASGRAVPVPLHVRFHSRHDPIVGTSLAYFDYRRLQLAEGRAFAMLGEAVIGANVAKRRQLGIADSLISSPESLFDLAGVYPLKMEVVGVLAPTFGPDDDAIFVDVKTSWVIQGLGHGHQDLAKPDAGKAVLRRDGDKIIANASVTQYNEITTDNLASFHFHGDPANYPLTAILPATTTHRDKTLLLGEFDGHDHLQLLEPKSIVEELIATLLQLEQFVLLAVLLVGGATTLVIAMVFVLSQRLRANEFSSMSKMGGARSLTFLLQASEAAIVLLLSITLAAVLTFATQSWGISLIQGLIF